MKPKGEMELLVVEPKNYDRIIELSKTTREGAYSIEELEDMRAKGLALNHIVTIAFYQGAMYAPADLWEVKE